MHSLHKGKHRPWQSLGVAGRGGGGAGRGWAGRGWGGGGGDRDRVSVTLLGAQESCGKARVIRVHASNRGKMVVCSIHGRGTIIPEKAEKNTGT